MADEETERRAEAERDAMTQVIELDEAREEERQKSQAFFAQLAGESRKPHFGDMQKDWLKALLVRAQEAQLYDPTKDTP